MNFLKKVREANPLVHNITNIVVANFTANGLLALGASPFMADSCEEMEDVAALAGAVVLNIGTLNDRTIEAMRLAGQAANKLGVPLVLDPVGAGATPYRTEVTHRLIAELKLTALRGNVAEIAHVIGEQWSIKGVDAGDGDGDRLGLAVRTANKLGCIVIITGAEDVVSDGKTAYLIRGGDPILTRVTGTGCLLSAVVGAFLAVAENHPLEAAAEALAVYAAAAELAAESAGDRGPGSFQVEFLNMLARITPEECSRRANTVQAQLPVIWG